MGVRHAGRPGARGLIEQGSAPVQGVGKSTAVERAFSGSTPARATAEIVQARGSLGPGASDIQRLAAAGVAGSGQELPHLDLVQRAFGPHDVSGVRAHVGGAAATAGEALGAQAYATGDQIAFRAAPDLHTAAHEAAHVVQQRRDVQLTGGVGVAGDVYEQQADAVADRVVRGEQVGELLGEPGGGASSAAVQLQGDDEGFEDPRWILTLRDLAKLRAGPSTSDAVLLELAVYDTPLYYLGHWKNDATRTAYDPGDGTVPPFPLRWLEAELRHPDWPQPVRGWMHSGVTHYPRQISEPTADLIRTYAVTGPAVPATSGAGAAPVTGQPDGDQPAGAAPVTGQPDGGQPVVTADPDTGMAAGQPDAGQVAIDDPLLVADVPEDKLVVLGAGLDVPSASGGTPQEQLAALPRLQPFLTAVQGDGTSFNNSPNRSDSALSWTTVGSAIAILGLVRGQYMDYETFNYRNGLPGGTVRRSDIWLICEYMGGTYFVHAGATEVTNSQLAAALGAAPPEPDEPAPEAAGEAGMNYDDWIEEGEHLAELPEAASPDLVAYQAQYGFEPDELIPAGYLPAGEVLDGTTAFAAVPLKLAPEALAPHIEQIAQGTTVAVYGMIARGGAAGGTGDAWVRARLDVPENNEPPGPLYGWIAAARLTDPAGLAERFGPAAGTAAAPSTDAEVQLPGVGTIHVTPPAGTDALASPDNGTLVAHLAPGFAIARVYEVVLGQAVARSAGLSDRWLRIGLTRESAPDEITHGYVPQIDTSFDAPIPPISGGVGGGADGALSVTVENPDVYVYSTPAFNPEAQLIEAALLQGHVLAVLWQEDALDGSLWLRVRTDTIVGTLEGYVAAARTSYAGGAPTPPVHRIESSSALPGAGAQPATITGPMARIRPNAAAGADDAILGVLPNGAAVTVLLHYESQDMAAIVETDLGPSSTWLYIEVPEDQVVNDTVGNPMEAPPQRGWIHASLTSLGGSGAEAMNARPNNEGADELQMPGRPPPLIDGPLEPGMIGPEVQMAKVRLVQLRYMNMSEYRLPPLDYYSGWTREAVRTFQLLAMSLGGEQVTGIISPTVWRALFATTTPEAHMTLDAVEDILAATGLAGTYQWDDEVNNPYAYEHFGSKDYWGPGLPGGQCTWFVRSVLTRLDVRSPSGSWPRDLAQYVQPAPVLGGVMQKDSHVAIITAVSSDGASFDVIECNWNYSRGVGVRTGLPVEEGMTFIAQPP